MIYLLVALLLVFLVHVVIVSEKRRVARFNQRFPPIDDEEFIRRCGPGVNRDTAIRVRKIISEQLGVEYAQVYPEQSFVNDLDCG
ncbi:MAG: hypothetical protein AB7O62_17375 [Pirellulales bacterium]